MKVRIRIKEKKKNKANQKPAARFISDNEFRALKQTNNI